MELIKNKLSVEITLPKKDLSGWNYKDKETITVTTEFNPQTNSFIFRLRIPKYIFDGVKDTDEKYFTNPPKPENSWESRKKKFTQNLSYPVLDVLLENLNNVCADAIMIKERESAETEKYIAVRFGNGHKQCKDNFNFASMGMLTTSSFQFFVVYKDIKSPHSLDRYIYKSKVRIGGNMGMKDHKVDGWYYFGIGNVEQYQLIRWTQEREDFFKEIEEKFVMVNKELDKYLGDITDDKIIALMENKQLFLGE